MGKTSKGETFTGKGFNNTNESTQSYTARSRSTKPNKSSLKETQDSIPLFNQSNEENFSKSRFLEENNQISIHTRHSMVKEESKEGVNEEDQELVQFDEPTFRMSPKPPIPKILRIPKKRRSRSKRKSRSKNPKNPKNTSSSNICLSGRKIMAEDTEISVCCATNQVQYKQKKRPITGNEITQFYNHLVDSDFTNISSSPVTFPKDVRFKPPREASPGPGYYNPSRSKLSGYKQKNMYQKCKKRDSCARQLNYFN